MASDVVHTQPKEQLVQKWQVMLCTPSQKHSKSRNSRLFNTFLRTNGPGLVSAVQVTLSCKSALCVCCKYNLGVSQKEIPPGYACVLQILPCIIIMGIDYTLQHILLAVCLQGDDGLMCCASCLSKGRNGPWLEAVHCFCMHLAGS